ncbi:MAG: DUF6340 family protein [Tannerella sp.]|nr:DUF6340 family protein [Tannerella sp.]
MKNVLILNLKLNIIVLLLLSFAACSPVRYMGIETYNPSGITFPREVKSVLIVNNAVPQPEVPFESTMQSKRDSVHISADSAFFDFCRTLGLEIAASPYFEDVRLLEEGYRKDKYFFTDRMLSTNDVSLLCEEHDVDAIVSLDQLMFRIRESAWKSSEFDFEGWMEIDVTGVIRAYLPERNTPLTSILISDTISPQLGYDILDVASVLVYPEIMLRETAKAVAEKSSVNFVPYWSNDVRWYYVSSNAQWKEAAASATLDRWEQAYDKWKAVYDKTPESSWQSKSRLASNMALSKELTGDFAKALYWATESYRLLQGKLKESDRNFTLQKLYIDVLKHRILADKRLHNQIDE